MDNKVYHTHVGIVNIMLYLCRKVGKRVCMGRYESSFRKHFKSWLGKMDARSWKGICQAITFICL